MNKLYLYYPQGMTADTSPKAASFFATQGAPKSTVEYLWDHSRYMSMQFIDTHLDKALVFRQKQELWTYLLSKMDKEGLVLELGVAAGESIRHIGRYMSRYNDRRTVYGFDSFEGLAEDWVGHFRPAGSYTLNGQFPEVPKNVELIKGWIEDTIPPFLKDKDDKISFLHIDTDTYSPCVFALEETHKWWKEGTIILFDELIGFPGWKQGELKAFTEFQKKHKNFKFDYIGFSNEQAAIIVTKLP